MLKVGDFFFILKDADWNLKQSPNTQASFGLIIRSGEKELMNIKPSFFILDKTTVVLTNLTLDFLKAMSFEGSLIVVMPDPTVSPDIPLTEALPALKAMIECINQSAKIIILNPTKGIRVNF